MVSKKRTGNDPERVVGDNTPEAPRGSGIMDGDGDSNTLQAPTRNSGRHSSDYIAGWRAHAYELVETGGLTSNRLGLEILYLLPDEFVTVYQRLFHAALTGGGGESVMGGKKGGGLDKAKGATGMVTGSETKLQAMGGGKQYKNTPMFVAGDGSMLRVKDAVDKGLVLLAREIIGLERRRILEGRRDSGVALERSELKALMKSLPRSCDGRVMVTQVGGGGEMRGCGRFLKAEWKYCPTCGHEVSTMRRDEDQGR